MYVTVNYKHLFYFLRMYSVYIWYIFFNNNNPLLEFFDWIISQQLCTHLLQSLFMIITVHKQPALVWLVSAEQAMLRVFCHCVTFSLSTQTVLANAKCLVHEIIMIHCILLLHSLVTDTFLHHKNIGYFLCSHQMLLNVSVTHRLLIIIIKSMVRIQHSVYLLP